MAKRIENDCVSCGLPCLGSRCPNRSVAHYYCDNCGEEFESDKLFKWNGQDYCKECIINDVESDLEKAYPLD